MGKEGREDGWAGMALWQSLGEDDGFGYDGLSFLALWSGEDGLEGDREFPVSLEMGWVGGVGWDVEDAFLAIPIMVEMSWCIELDCFLSRSISDKTLSMRLVRDVHPEHADAGEGAEIGIATDGEGVGAAGVDCGGDPEEGGGDVVAGGGPLGAGRADDDVVEGGGIDAGGAEGCRLGKYCDIFAVLIPSSRSRNLSERKEILSSFFFMLESRLVILVWAKFNCICRYSFLAASSVTAGAGAFLALLGGGAASALGGRGAALCGGS